MRSIYLFIVLFCLTSSATNAQTDTTFEYFNDSWKPTVKDSAKYYTAFYNENGLFKRRDYNMATKALHMQGSFTDKEHKTRQGAFVWYYPNGSTRDSILYEAGKRKLGKFYYETGAKKALVTFDGSKVKQQQGWDETGKEIEDFVYEKAPEFPGGMAGWRRYLERNLNANAAAEDKAPIGNYTVKVQFIVDKEGNVSNVQAVMVPSLCPSCGREVERIIRKGPRWVPAVQFGKPVIYQAMQYVTFQVSTS